MITLDVRFTPKITKDTETAIAIDVLRASSTIVTSLARGAEKVIITSSVKEAKEIKRKHPDFVLAGERNTLKIKGFDYGNSPSELSKANLENKSVILTTTNGTRLLKNLKKHAKLVLTASSLNISAVASTMVEIIHHRKIKEITMVCAGVKGEPVLDDIGIAGMLAKKISTLTDTTLTDAALGAVRIANSFPSLRELFLTSTSGKRVVAAGYTSDIDFCTQTDLYPLSPFLVADTYLSLKTFNGLTALPL